MHPDVSTASKSELGTDTNDVQFTFFHKWKRETVEREIVEWVGDDDLDPYTIDDGKFTVIGVTDAGDLVLVSTADGSVSIFTDIDLIQSDVCASVADFLDMLVIETFGEGES